MMALVGPRISNVVVARSAEGNRELSAKLRRMGMRPIPVESVKFAEPSDWRRVDGSLRSESRFDWFVLTSVRGAESFAKRFKRRGVSPTRRFPRIAAVGEKTAERLKKDGFLVDFVPSEYLTASIGRELPADFGKRVLLLRAQGAGGEVVKLLRMRGFHVESAPIYSTTLVGTMLKGTRLDHVDAVLLGSPSEVEGLVRRLPDAVLTRLKDNALAACIGPVTARAARKAGFKRILSSKLHTFDALLMEVRRSVTR